MVLPEPEPFYLRIINVNFPTSTRLREEAYLYLQETPLTQLAYPIKPKIFKALPIPPPFLPSRLILFPPVSSVHFSSPGLR